MTGAVVLVPHTHWDREWYEPLQRFRLRLLDVVDDVIVRAIDDPEFRFTFDGQTAAVEDYLEVRPERRADVAALSARGQFAVGPWRVLLDEFCCSGENIIRNLQIGHRQAAALGPVMDVGYLPDMFGHAAQMPQILRRAGLEHACVFRGVPMEIEDHAFRWVAPDGSWVRAEYLIAGYGNVSDLFDGPADLPGRLQRRLDGFAAAFGDDDVLAMYGTDHSGPLPTLMAMTARLNAESDAQVRVSTLQDYVAGFRADAVGLPQVVGEMRSHGRANILPGVISIRPHLKQALAEVERTVERYAEPFQTLWREGAWPTSLVDLAWLRLVDSSCHDSVTGCGVDDTAIQVATRIAEAGQIGRGLVDLVSGVIARDVPSDAAVVLNPSPCARRHLVTLDLPVQGCGAVVLRTHEGMSAVQELSVPERLLADECLDAHEVPVVFRRVHDRELFGRQIRRMVINEDAVPPVLRFDLGVDGGNEPWDPTLARAQAADAAARRPGPWRVRTVDEPHRVVLAEIDVPALGFAAARLESGDTVAPSDPVVADETGLAHGSLDVRIASDGTFTLTSGDVRVAGVGRIVEGGDAGDSYNYAPPADDLAVSEPSSVEISVLEVGPLRGRVLVRRRYDWPESSTQDARSTRSVPTDVDTVVELRRDEPFVRLEISFDNRASDHRVRLHLPCARPAETADACGQFAVTSRGRHPQAGPVGEFPLPTYPANSFVDAGGTAVLLEGTTEYELLADPDVVAITLVRGVGYLSRNRNRLRDEPAGPMLPTPLGQSPGPRTVRLAVMPHRGDWASADIPAAAEDFVLDGVPRVGIAAAGGQLPSPAAGFLVGGSGVRLSSLIFAPATDSDAIDVRVVAMTTTPTIACLAWPGRRIRHVRRIDLLGRDIPRHAPHAGLPVDVEPTILDDSTVSVALRPFEIATLRIEADPTSR